MLYTIKFTNTHKAINLDQIVKYDLSTISPTLIVDSTYVSHVSDQFDNTDDFISIPLYKRNQFCLLPANSSLTIETENNQEAIYYKQLTIDNCHIDVSDSSGGGGGGSDDNFVKMLLSNDFSSVDNTLVIPDYVQTIDASAITWSSKCSSLVMNNSVDITEKGATEFKPYLSQVIDIARFYEEVEDVEDYNVKYPFKEDNGITYVDINQNLSIYIKDCDIDINSIENRKSFSFWRNDSELISEYEDLFIDVFDKIFSIITKPINSSNDVPFYSTIHIQGNNYHVIFLHKCAETPYDSYAVLDLTDTIPQDRENCVIFEWVEETKELRNSLMHEINYDRNEPVYAVMYPPTHTSFDFYNYTEDCILANNIIYTAVYPLTIYDTPGYLIKDNTDFISVDSIEPFCLCGDRTRLIVSDNFKKCTSR